MKYQAPSSNAALQSSHEELERGIWDSEIVHMSGAQNGVIFSSRLTIAAEQPDAHDYCFMASHSSGD